MENLRRLGVAIGMYAMDHNDTMPPAGNWTVSLSPYLRLDQGPLNCPAVARSGEPNGYGYAFNVELAGKSTARIGRTLGIPLIFDSILADENAVSGLETLPDPPRHQNGNVNHVAYTDGSVVSMQRGAR